MSDENDTTTGGGTALQEAPKVDLFAGTEIAQGFEADSSTLVFGQDFYDDRDESDGGYQDKGDPISQAVGTPGYMSNHVVDECFEEGPDGSRTEPHEFDRFYFPPQDPTYQGLAPVLVDILEGVTDEERAEAAQAKQIAFKAAWCRSHGVSYVVLIADDLFLSPAELSAKIARGYQPTAATSAPADPDAALPPSPASTESPEAAATKKAAAPRRRRGQVQRPRKG